MKTKTTFLLSFLIIIVLLSNAQIIELNFSARLNGNHIPLDSIKVENLTQGGDTMLYANDTVLILGNTAIPEMPEASQNTAFFVSKNYPNPFINETRFSIMMKKDDKLTISVFDIMGRTITQEEMFLSSGLHSFSLSAGKQEVYLLCIETSEAKRFVKMIAINNSNSVATISYNGYKGNNSSLKATKDIPNWSAGDQLKYTAYATSSLYIFGSDTLNGNPSTNENYIFDITLLEACGGQTLITDIEGNNYRAVQIGNQCWMGENFRSRKFNDGTLIPYPGANTTAWANSFNGAYAWVWNDSSTYGVYGAVYNWYTVDSASNGGKNLCPIGWHVPSLEEVQTLVDYAALLYHPDSLGNRFKACKQVNHPISSCATTVHPRWKESSLVFGTDDLGFTAIPANERYDNGNWAGNFMLSYIGERARYWTTTEYSSTQGMQYLLGFYNNGVASPLEYNKLSGYSIRCIKD
jgi:uncharacterized protein (TIGR02145 family)